MELGNALFGNSRGKYPLERGKWQNTFCSIFKDTRLDPYKEFENDTFSFFPYYWGDCECGTDDIIDNFSAASKCSSDCFSTNIQVYQDSLKEQGLDYTKINKLLRAFCKEHEQNFEGCMVHCTCGAVGRINQFSEEHPHADTCRLIKPNFVFKPTGYEIEWYKYPLRDSYANQQISFDEFEEMIKICIESISNLNNEADRTVGP
jgi:hypothetical protein